MIGTWMNLGITATPDGEIVILNDDDEHPEQRFAVIMNTHTAFNFAHGLKKFVDALEKGEEAAGNIAYFRAYQVLDELDLRRRNV